MRLTRSALIAAALAGALAVPSAGKAQSGFSDEQRRGIEQIVKDYLIKNPEVLQEAITELERRQQEMQKSQQIAVLKQERDKVLNSPRGTTIGNPAGDITLVEFFDYNCGYCKRALGDVKGLVKADPK